ncbi:hypothetical protein F4780DRAFT_660978 [Xylariomycetidae sp. FL0641]|nr:hypothetical protein F4780DRAFT_660978 [Xylariomycetidae sp. FL0641]
MTCPTMRSVCPSPSGAARTWGPARPQRESVLFGKLPGEIRAMIYTECWMASGLKQHVFLDQHGRLAHAPCLHGPGQTDTRNEKARELCQARRASGSPSLSVDSKWASRFSSPWHDHWRCEERMRRDKRPRSLFMPILLACKQTYVEALPGLYASVTLLFTDLETPRRCLMDNLRSPAPLLRSLEFSLALPCDVFHQHRSCARCPGPWAELCTYLSNLVRFASLRGVVMRLDLAGDGFWWQVRERWLLSAVRGMLARCLVVQLPDVTHLAWARPYQYLEGDHTPFRLERYPSRQWFAPETGQVVPRVDPPPTQCADRRTDGDGTKAGRARRSLCGLLASLKTT